ncbi:MAG: hypothetical protein LR005_00440 [Candidatus Pacebacteria bacterium]|nr:hypothetical protein [Candidatus Paceibacterota bacterium]
MLDTLIQQKINELPKNIREAVEGFDWATEVLNIAQEYHLQINAMETFRREILLVIVGATDAINFEKNLVSRMDITHELAENLVADANENIFRPLQKIAFSRNSEDEIIEHREMSDIMDNHGITLVDDFVPEQRPENELQDLADSLFNNTESIIPDSDPKSHIYNNKEIIDTDETLNPVQSDNIVGTEKKIDYNEAVESSDLVGIHEHRINTNIINQIKPEGILQENNILKKTVDNGNTREHILLNKAYISKTASLDTSPTKTDLIKENNEFLKHISAS